MTKLSPLLLPPSSGFENLTPFSALPGSPWLFSPYTPLSLRCCVLSPLILPPLPAPTSLSHSKPLLVYPPPAAVNINRGPGPGTVSSKYRKKVSSCSSLSSWGRQCWKELKLLTPAVKAGGLGGWVPSVCHRYAVWLCLSHLPALNLSFHL